MTFSYKISLAEYRKLMIGIIVRRYGIFVLIIIAAGMFAKQLIYNEPFTIESVFWSMPSVVIALSAGWLFLRYFAKSTYKTDKIIQQQATWHIEDHTATIKTQSVTLTINMNSYYYIEETKDWFLLYLNSSVCHFIAKKVLTINEIGALRSTLSSLTGVSKVSLRKD